MQLTHVLATLGAIAGMTSAQEIRLYQAEANCDVNYFLCTPIQQNGCCGSAQDRYSALLLLGTSSGTLTSYAPSGAENSRCGVAISTAPERFCLRQSATSIGAFSGASATFDNGRVADFEAAKECVPQDPNEAVLADGTRFALGGEQDDDTKESIKELIRSDARQLSDVPESLKAHIIE